MESQAFVLKGLKDLQPTKNILPPLGENGK